jgi:O-antigen ligase/cytochrome c-type biogenesis protein CcmH/NrfG
MAMEKSLKIIRYLILGGIFLAPLIVLIVTSSLFFPFISGKNFFFRILTEIIFSLWLILAIFDKNYRPKKSWVLIAVASFTLILILSTIFSVNAFRSFWSNYERMEGLLAYLHLFAIFLVLTSMMKTEKLWQWFFHISLGVSIIVVVYGLLQLAGKLEIHQGGVRLDATLGNASYLAIYMVFHIFLALFLFLREKNWYKWFYLPVAVLNLSILYHTATRGAILGLMGGLLLAVILIVLFSPSKKIKIASALTLFLLVVLLGSFWLSRHSDFIQQSPVLARFSGISFQEATTQSRLVIWKMSWEGFKEKPLLGWGLENYNLIFNKYFQPILWKQEPWFDRAHNVFLDRLTTNGILGLIAYLGLFSSGLYYLWLHPVRNRKQEIPPDLQRTNQISNGVKRKKLGFSVYDSAILTSMFAAYFFHNLFVFDNIISSILFFSFLGYISSRTHLEAGLPSQLGSPASKNLGAKSAYAIVIGIAVVFIIYFINVPGILAGRSLINAFQSSAKGDLQTSFQKFQKSISYNSFGSTEAREHLISFAMQILQQPNLENNFKREVFDFSVSEMKKQVAQAPNDIRYMIFLASLYNKAGQYDDAIGLLQRAVIFSPQKQQLYFELGTSYLNKKEHNKALEVLRIAFELEPNYFEARKIYALAAIFAGKDDLAEELMENYGGIIIPDQRLINAFVERKKFAQAAAVWEKIIEQEPNNAQYHISLGATYLQMAERQKAIVQLQKAIELEPKFKEQGEYYINEIRAGRNP